MTRMILFTVFFSLFTLDRADALVVVPQGLNPGDQYRLVFVTSGVTDATSSDIDYYNDFVGGFAASVVELDELNTDWRAIASTASLHDPTATIDASENTGTDGTADDVPIYRLDGARIAVGNQDLWDGVLESAITTTEDGNIANAGLQVWTGTTPTGIAFAGETLGTSTPVYGITTGGHWVASGFDSNSLLQPLYAMSGTLTVPSTGVVPEASSALVFLGIACTGMLVVTTRSARHRCHT
jgi:hypothetical protein